MEMLLNYLIVFLVLVLFFFLNLGAHMMLTKDLLPGYPPALSFLFLLVFIRFL